MTPAQALLTEAIDYLIASRVALVITEQGYEIDGQPVSEGGIVARAFALGMAGTGRKQ